MNRGLRNELASLGGLVSAGLFLGRQNKWATLLGLASLGLSMIPTPTYSFQNRSVLITGGSRGLGLAIAEQFLSEGASVTLLARDKEELERAKEQLSSNIAEHRVSIISCDITEPDQVQRAFKEAIEQAGRIDIVVNNAGCISVGPFETMQPSEFEAQIDLHLNAAIHITRLAVSEFKRTGEGRIVNISSIGGDIPVPHMTPYCASKFALAGFSEAVGAELADLNIKVTTVYPGLMRTGSPIQAIFKGDHEKEYGWFAASDVLPGLSVSARSAARKIVEGVRHGDARVSFPTVTKIGIVGHAALPETYAFIARQAARYMPKGQSKIRKTGADSQGWLEQQRWYQPLKGIEDKAERQLNQKEKFDANFNLGLKSRRSDTYLTP